VRGESPELDRIERWMFEVVTHPGGAAEGVRSESARLAWPVDPEQVDTVVLPARGLSGTRRLGIYADMYWWRLTDILYEDYPALHRLLGAERFCRIARLYLAAHPSRSPHLALLGAALPRFLDDLEDDDLPHPSFAVEIARLERAIEDVFDAEETPPIDSTAIESIPPEDAALAIVDFEYPVLDWYAAVRASEDAAPPPPPPGTETALVHRRSYVVERRRLERAEAALLCRLMSGDRLGEAIEAVAMHPEVDPAGLAPAIGAWFRDWTAAGIVSGIAVEPS
jgi:hypothetical protein